jgi:hypothetical protein
MLHYFLTCHNQLAVDKYEKHDSWFYHTVNQTWEKFRLVAIKTDKTTSIFHSILHHAGHGSYFGHYLSQVFLPHPPINPQHLKIWLIPSSGDMTN